MEILNILCGISFVLVLFALLAVIALFISCDLAAEQEKKQILEDKKNR